MPQAQTMESPFSLNLSWKSPFKPMVEWSLERMLGLPALDSLYSQVSGSEGGDFIGDVLNLLRIDVDVSEQDLAHIPSSGPAVVVANHPFGAIEGVVLLHTLRRIRPDVKVMANHLLGVVPELREHIISVDPFGTEKSKRSNISGLKESIRWAKNGGLLAVFPAGEVSSVRLDKAAVTDPRWSPTVGRIIHRAKAPAVPVHFKGTNGPLFHLLGLIHPRLRTMMLPRELLNKQRRALHLDIGKPLPARKAAELDDDKLTELLRLRTYLLGERSKTPAKRLMPASLADAQPIAKSCGADALEAEIESQPEENVLLAQGDYKVICAQGRYLVNILPEIGRLREISFREVGEGTGEPRDLDRYDDYYHHLVLWNTAEREIVGAYRVGRADVIVEGFGIEGLYTSTLFKYDRKFLDDIGPALEVGRAFVSAKYRKNYNPLMLLWKGIATFVHRQGRYRVLFGPCSISNDYLPLSRNMMMRFLKACHCTDKSLAKKARPLVPPRLRTRVPGGFRMGNIANLCPDIEDLGTAVADIEADGKGIPVLLRHYLKLGGCVLTFNLDREFGDAIDGLMVVDLAKAPPKALARYMGKDESTMFLAKHGD